MKVFDSAGLFPTDLAVEVTPGPDSYVAQQYFAYDPTFTGGARVAVGDVNADGKADIVTAAGPKGGPHVRIFSGADGTVIREWMAYDTLFTGGVYVTAGDLTGDGKAEIVTGMAAAPSAKSASSTAAAGGNSSRSFPTASRTGPRPACACSTSTTTATTTSSPACSTR